MQNVVGLMKVHTRSRICDLYPDNSKIFKCVCLLSERVSSVVVCVALTFYFRRIVSKNFVFCFAFARQLNPYTYIPIV